MSLLQLSRRQEIDKELQAKANEEREELRKKAAEERESSAKELEEVKKLKAEKLLQVEVRGVPPLCECYVCIYARVILEHTISAHAKPSHTLLPAAVFGLS